MRITPIDEKSLKVPAVFVNHFQMTVLGHSMVRLSLAELATPQSTPVHRVAVLMAIEDARQFCEQILNALSISNSKPM
jgi:hypothetical protein